MGLDGRPDPAQGAQASQSVDDPLHSGDDSSWGAALSAKALSKYAQSQRSTRRKAPVLQDTADMYLNQRESLLFSGGPSYPSLMLRDEAVEQCMASFVRALGSWTWLVCNSRRRGAYSCFQVALLLDSVLRLSCMAVGVLTPCWHALPMTPQPSIPGQAWLGQSSPDQDEPYLDPKPQTLLLQAACTSGAPRL